MVGWGETPKSQFVCSCGVTTGGWVGSAQWVGVRLGNHNFWFLWCQHGWLSGVSTVGWGATHRSKRLCCWGGKTRRRWQERYHEALPSLSTVLAWSVAGDYDFDKGIAPIISLFDGVFVAALRVLGSSMWRGYGYTETFIRTLNIVATLIIIDICQYVHIVDDCRCMTIKLQLINKLTSAYCMTVLVLFTDAPWSNHVEALPVRPKNHGVWVCLGDHPSPFQDDCFSEWVLLHWSRSQRLCIDFVVCHRVGDAEMSSWICSLRILGLSELRSWQPELCKLKCKLPYLLRVPINDNPCLTCVDLAVLLI